jgi:hypothetical protein
MDDPEKALSRARTWHSDDAAKSPVVLDREPVVVIPTLSEAEGEKSAVCQTSFLTLAAQSTSM